MPLHTTSRDTPKPLGKSHWFAPFHNIGCDCATLCGKVDEGGRKEEKKRKVTMNHTSLRCAFSCVTLLDRACDGGIRSISSTSMSTGCLVKLRHVRRSTRTSKTITVGRIFYSHLFQLHSISSCSSRSAHCARLACSPASIGAFCVPAAQWPA